MFAGCGGGSQSPPTATPSATTPPPTATATVRPALLSPLPDGALAIEHVEALSVGIGARPAGSPEELEAAAYLEGQLRSYGYAVERQPFPFESELAREVRLEQTGPPGGRIVALTLRQSPAGTATGPLVLAGLGRPEDMPPEGLAGRIALIERGELRFSQKVANAAAAGASAVVIFNNERGLYSGDLREGGSLPTLGISDEDGAALRALLEQGPVEVSLKVGPLVEGTGHNVIARRVPGAPCETVTGGHYDSTPFGPGANDNASGTAAVLELARVVGVRGVPGRHCFILFGAEEIGLVGSAAFVATLSEADRQALRAMINFDVLSAGEGWDVIGSPEMVQIAVDVAQAAGIAVRPGELPPNLGSDHQSFNGAGVPVVFFMRTGGDFFDRVIHTPDDVIAIVRPSDLEEAVTMGAGVLEALSRGE